MLNNFYDKQNYFKEKLEVFTLLKENQKIIIKDNELSIKNINNPIDECVVMSFIYNIFNNENCKTLEIKKKVEKLFSEYLNFIDSIIFYIYKKECFQDQYLILLSEIEKNISNINNGLILLIANFDDNFEDCDKCHDDNSDSDIQDNCELNKIYKSVLFSFFDFSSVLQCIKKKINDENIEHYKNIKHPKLVQLMERKRMNSF